MSFSGSWFRWVLLCFAVIIISESGCGKNLLQIFDHPSVDQRARDSLNGVVAVPSPAVMTDPTSFRFAVFGDVQVRPENKTTLTLFKADVSSKSINFFVILGDLTEDGTDGELSQIKSDLDDVGVPYYATIGNHDLFQAAPAGGWNTWKSTFGAATYSVTIAGVVRFLLLDTSSGDIGQTQFNWLTTQLKTQVPFTLVGSHYPVNDGMTPSMWRLESLEERFKITNLLDKYGVFAYVGGHVHGFRQGQVGNVLHLTIGSMYPYTLDFGDHGYVLFTYDHGNLTWERVTLPSGS